jgi:hypothetical protein
MPGNELRKIIEEKKLLKIKPTQEIITGSLKLRRRRKNQNKICLRKNYNRPKTNRRSKT